MRILGLLGVVAVAVPEEEYVALRRKVLDDFTRR